MEVRQNSGRNPLIIISPDEVIAWLREKANEAGFSDRSMCAVQVTVEHPFIGGTTYHSECPTLVLMVSNISNSQHPQSSVGNGITPIDSR